MDATACQIYDDGVMGIMTAGRRIILGVVVSRSLCFLDEERIVFREYGTNSAINIPAANIPQRTFLPLVP